MGRNLVLQNNFLELKRFRKISAAHIRVLVNVQKESNNEHKRLVEINMNMGEEMNE